MYNEGGEPKVTKCIFIGNTTTGAGGGMGNEYGSYESYPSVTDCNFINNTATQGGGTINTAYIERLNATFRQRLHCLVRRSRALARRTETLVAGMYLVGTVYNFCTYHDSLLLHSDSSTKCPRTPAMAAGLTDQRWTLHDLLTYKVFKRPATTVMKLPTKFQSYAVKDLVA